MADITSRYDGNVDDSDQVNWRGDQVTVPQGGQSIYDTSSIKLTELGSRKVVGDRVFRYALAAMAIAPGDVVEGNPGVELTSAIATANASGGKQITFTATAAITKDAFADGYITVSTGTQANLGYTYKIKSHSAIASAATGSVTLYDPIKLVMNTADKVDLQANLYGACNRCTTGIDALIVGVAPTLVTSGNYFWLQTWGPAGLKCAAGATGAVAADVTGQCIAYNSAQAQAAHTVIGQAMCDIVASQNGMVYVTIAP